MKKLKCFSLLFCLCCFALQSCDDDDTYADRKKRERALISSFIRDGICVIDEEMNDTTLYVPPIQVIPEWKFIQQDSTTDVSNNEYVLFASSGIYMQIVRKGAGKKIGHGESPTVLARYVEYNLMGDSIQTRNDITLNYPSPDVFVCSNNYGVFTASFMSGVMYTSYSASVPSAWLRPLSYINIGRAEGDEEDAVVRLIVPHSEGQKNASENVYPCFYEIKYRRGRS